jgi:hypothetical protein
MGSRQKAVKAFLDAVSIDPTMMDRWIPDEDWVRQIRENGLSDCSVVNFNTGMSQQCLWQNDHAILKGRTIILHNKKNVRTCKNKATIKVIRFYYVMSAASFSAPNVPSDKGFYQSLWDDPDRSNRSLKRTAPPAPASKNKVDTPPTKRAKASSPTPGPVSPENVPTSFRDASRMVQEAWKVAFPSLRFPVELIGLFPPASRPLVAAPHEIQASTIHQPTSQSKVEISKNLESQFLKERAFYAGLKKTLIQNSNQPTEHTKHLFAAFAASHPQISVIYQEIIIAVARYTFLLEIKAAVENSGKAKGMDLSFINLENVANSSPSATSLTNWVSKLARDQYMIFSQKI